MKFDTLMFGGFSPSAYVSEWFILVLIVVSQKQFFNRLKAVTGLYNPRAIPKSIFDWLVKRIALS
jgi:hypothetical protein